MRNDYDGGIVYYGIKNSEMWYDFDDGSWKLKTNENKENNTFGVSLHHNFISFSLGKSDWTVKNDGKDCI